MLDCGIKLHSGESPEPPLAAAPEAAIISHAHLDHSGFSPALFAGGNVIECFATPPTVDLCELLLRDTLKIQKLNRYKLFSSGSLKRWKENVKALPYNMRIEWRGYEFGFGDAGHIPGSAWIEVIKGGKKIVYSGDYKLEDTLLMKKGTVPKNVDILMTESTYSRREHPDRDQLVKQILEETKMTFENGGCALFPAFALGRSQELAIMLSKLDIPFYIDGMAKSACEIAMEYPEYVRNFDELYRALKKAMWVGKNMDRDEILKEPCAIITTAGMLEGGPVLEYIFKLNQNSRIFITGYQVKGTKGYELLNTGSITIDGERRKVKTPWAHYDLSAHAGRSQLFEFVKGANPQKVFCMHGDSCESFAQELKEMGFDAYAPQVGEAFEI